MAKCIMCANLAARTIKLDDKVADCFVCLEGKFNIDGTTGYYSQDVVLKSGKSVKAIEENCDKWIDRFGVKK